MSKFIRSGLALVLLVGFSFFLAGCGGGGTSGTVQTQTPETAVRELVASWKNNPNAPYLSLDTTGRMSVVFQTVEGSTASDTISFMDLSGNEWHFTIESIVRPSSNRAEVRTSTSFGYITSDPEATRAYITFIMDLDEGSWYLSDMIIEIPTVIVVTDSGIEGFVSEKGNPDTRLEGAIVTLYQGETKISEATTDANGYYRFTDLYPGTYTLVFTGGGYESLTITDVIVN